MRTAAPEGTVVTISMFTVGRYHGRQRPATQRRGMASMAMTNTRAASADTGNAAPPASPSAHAGSRAAGRGGTAVPGAHASSAWPKRSTRRSFVCISATSPATGIPGGARTPSPTPSRACRLTGTPGSTSFLIRTACSSLPRPLREGAEFGKTGRRCARRPSPRSPARACGYRSRWRRSGSGCRPPAEEPPAPHRGTGYSPPPRSRNIPIDPHSSGNPASKTTHTRETVSFPKAVKVGMSWANQLKRNMMPKNRPP